MGEKHQINFKLLLLLTLCFNVTSVLFAQNSIHLVKEIRGSISPKSIVHSGNGIFSAQNMMYRHTVTLYTANGDLISTIEDKSNLKQFGFTEYTEESYMGGPVEACFSEQGKFLWVSNYSMVGKEFKKEGCDACVGDIYDPSFIYKINTQTHQIENVIKVGAVPKYLAINEPTQKMVVTNWTSSDVSIIDLNTEKEIKRIKVGAHPRGVEITKDGKTAYVTVMGSTKIAKIDMTTYALTYITNVGKSPRHLVLDANDNYLYCSVNSANKIVKIDLKTDERMTCTTKAGPRTMVLSSNQRYLYVVNYFTDSFQKVDAKTMEVVETISTGHHPIGITANWATSEIWVACYSGKIQIFKDPYLDSDMPLWPDFFANNAKQYYQKKEIKPQSKVVEQPKVLEPTNQEKIEPIPDEIAINNQDNSISNPKIKNIPTYNSMVYLKQKEPVKKPNQIEKKTEPIIEKTEEIVSQKEDDTQVNQTMEVAKNPEGCRYHLIIGSFGLYANAKRLSSEMIEKGYAAQLITSKNNKMTMVSIQCFNSEAEANASKNQILKESKQKGWVYKA